MVESYLMKEHYIPDGILHDQNLYAIKLENNVLTLSFEIYYYPQNYRDASLVEKYKDFTRCHIKCLLDEEESEYCDAELITVRNKKKVHKTKTMELSEFVDLANKEIGKRNEKGFFPWTYLDTSVSPNCHALSIQLSTWTKYKRTAYSQSSINLYTDKIEFIWE